MSSDIAQGTSQVQSSSTALPTTPKWLVGVCALELKARSGPMKNILNHLRATGEFEMVLFGDKVILHEPVSDWPFCDFLISFYSDGFPLEKAMQYLELRSPYCINDLSMQTLLLDRRLVLAILDAIGVPTPPRVVVNRDGGPRISKPLAKKMAAFVRKLSNLPVIYPHGQHQYYVYDKSKESALTKLNLTFAGRLSTSLSPGLIFKEDPENPNAIILYNHCVTAEEASQPTPDSIKVRDKEMKKPFVEKPVLGEDHNVYIYYAQADGGGVRKLFRKIGNKSSEYSPEMTEVRKTSSYIYEEFMKVDNSEDIKCYTIGPSYCYAETRKSPVVDGVVRRNTDGKEIRNATILTDQEQEMARRVCIAFGQWVCGLDMLRANGKSYVCDVNGFSFVKGNKEYYELCARMLRDVFLKTAKKRSMTLVRAPSVENRWKLKGYISVLRHADRQPKQKLKFYVKAEYFSSWIFDAKEDVILRTHEQLKSVAAAVDLAFEHASPSDVDKLEQLRNILQKKITVPGTKVQIKPVSKKNATSEEKVQLIVKWGGEFTHSGYVQSHDLGESLRKDLLLLNKELFEDIKLYSSTERRVIATADVFARSFLNKADIAEDFITLSKEMLDDSYAAKEQMDNVKTKLQEILRGKLDPTTIVGSIGRFTQQLTPEEVVEITKNPSSFLRKVMDSLEVCRGIMRKNFKEKNVEEIQSTWCCSESPELFKERWEKMFKDFCDVTLEEFDPSKVSELYDSLKYDGLHNRQFVNGILDMGTRENEQEKPQSSEEVKPNLPKRDHIGELYRGSKILFDYVGPQEYGITDGEKLEIGTLTSLPILNQLLSDFLHVISNTVACTRLYFTKESHVHTLFNVVMLCGLPVISRKELPCELDYLTQIAFEIYSKGKGMRSDATEDPENTEYSVRIVFSPGAHDPNIMDLEMDNHHALSVAPKRWVSDYISLDDVLGVFRHLINFGLQSTAK